MKRIDIFIVLSCEKFIGVELSEDKAKKVAEIWADKNNLNWNDEWELHHGVAGDFYFRKHTLWGTCYAITIKLIKRYE